MTGRPSGSEIVVCAACRHMRGGTPPALFRGRGHSAAMLEIQNEYQRELDQVAELERERVEVGQPFEHTPRHYPWCARLTKERGAVVRDPVTGESRRGYVLCRDGNHDGQCRAFEKK